MLIATPPDECSSSSLGTTEDWETVNVQGSGDEASRTNDNGTLILQGEEEEEEEPHLLNDGETLSIPGTDSIPTIVNSIDALPTEVVDKPEETEEVVVEDDTKKDEVAGAAKEEPRPKNTCENMDVPSMPNLSPGPMNTKVLLTLLASSTLLLCATTIGYVSQRGTNKYLRQRVDGLEWNIEYVENSLSILEEENRLLRRENRQIVLLEDKLEELKKENQRMKKDEQLRWDDCQKTGNETLLVDNCWVKADIQLGDCAQDAKDSIKDYYTSLLGQFLNTSDTFKTKSEDEFEVSLGKFMNKMDSIGKDFGSTMDSVGKSLWKTLESKSEERGRELNELFSKMDGNAKAWFKSVMGEEGKSDPLKEGKPTSQGMDSSFKGLLQMMAAGDNVMAKVLERAAEAMEMNETEVKQAMAKMFKEASMVQHAAPEEK